MTLKIIPLALLLAAASTTAFGQTAVDTTADTTSTQVVDTTAQVSTEAVPEVAPAQTVPATGPVVLFTRRTAAPEMWHMTPVNAQFGLLSSSLMESAGETIVRENAIADPSNELARKFAEHFATKNGFTLAADTLTIDGKVKDIRPYVKTQNQSADYAVEAAQTGMTLTYFPFDWAHYGLRFNSVVRITDLKTGKVVVEAKCKVQPKPAGELHTDKELIADKATLLKSLIDEKLNECLSAMIASSEAKIVVAAK